MTLCFAPLKCMLQLSWVSIRLPAHIKPSVSL